MNLPYCTNLPVNKLASVFGSTSATYKFYWLIALIELVEDGNIEIPKRKLFSRMISNSWYTINYFHVSFGKQDNLQIAVERILKEEKLTIDLKKNTLETSLENSTNKETINQLYHFDKNVPHWFLSPWFPKINNESDNQQKTRIYADSQLFLNDAMYALHKDYIQINPIWISYLKSNAKVLKDYCYWNLALFLQTRNPNVPDIPNKLIKPATRNGLTKQTNEYWKLVFNELGSIECVFTGNKLIFDEKKYAVDHFVPHAFVSHDLIWNLIPIDKSFNSYKGDKLPSVDKYFDKFYNLQKTAFEIVKSKNIKNKYLEEYLAIFPDLDDTNSFDYQRYKQSILPLIAIAQNNSFSFMKD
jgi:hypothetical protein